MIRGYFSISAARRRPFIDAVFQFPTADEDFEVPVLIDAGTDRTILSPVEALRLALDFGIDFATFELGPPSTGIGGQAPTRLTDVVLRLDTFSTSLQLTVLEPPASGLIPPIPSLLGRDVISRFGLFVDQRTEQVLLLDAAEVDILNLPQQSS